MMKEFYTLFRAMICIAFTLLYVQGFSQDPVPRSEHHVSPVNSQENVIQKRMKDDPTAQSRAKKELSIKEGTNCSGKGQDDRSREHKDPNYNLSATIRNDH